MPSRNASPAYGTGYTTFGLLSHTWWDTPSTVTCLQPLHAGVVPATSRSPAATLARSDRFMAISSYPPNLTSRHGPRRPWYACVPLNWQRCQDGLRPAACRRTTPYPHRRRPDSSADGAAIGHQSRDVHAVGECEPERDAQDADAAVSG